MSFTDLITPAFLQKGDKVGVVAPASRVNYRDLIPGIALLKEEWGLEVVEGKTLTTDYYQFSGTDEERLKDVQSLLDNPEIKAIIAARGGYGFSRLLDQLDFSIFKKYPKWLVGFSDVTAVLSHLEVLGYQSMHAPMVKLLCQEGGEVATESLRQALFGEKLSYAVSGHEFNRPGSAEGSLVGGNLCLLAHLIGSSSEVFTQGKILFIEDVSEYLYNLDRMMVQLKRSGKLGNLAGLIVGQFTNIKDNAAPVFGKDAYEIVREHVSEFDYPVCFNFPVGHVVDNRTLIVGGNAQLQVAESGVSLLIN